MRFSPTLLLSSVLGLASPVALAAIYFEVEAHALQWLELDASAMQIQLDWHDNAPRLQGQIQRLDIPQWGVFEAIEWQCASLDWTLDAWSCPRGQVVFHHAELGRQQIAIQAHFDQRQPQRSSLVLEAHSQLDPAWLQSLARIGVAVEQVASIRADMHWQLRLMGDWLTAEFSEIALTARMQSLHFSDAASRYLAEDVALQLEAHIWPSDSDWQLALMVGADQGQSYLEPFYFDVAAHPWSLEVHGTWHEQTQQWSLEPLIFAQDGVFSAQGDIQLDADGQIRQWQLSASSLALEHFVPIWIRPMLLGSAFSDLAVTGTADMQVSGGVQLEHLAIALHNVHLEDPQQRLAAQDLEGNIAWTLGEEPVDSVLSFQSAQLFQLPLGPSRLEAVVAEGTLQIVAPWTVPILDGQLEIAALQLTLSPELPMQWAFSGTVHPISLEPLSRALDWPILYGRIAGVIPSVQYSAQQLRLDGALEVEVFGGQMQINALQLSEPFGVLPQLEAQVQIRNWDLDTLTRTFDFGQITGRLDGEIAGLRLSNWQAVEFDARFYSSALQPTRRRISQKAVDNLSQIGGGFRGALSRNFMRYFDAFSYQAIGLNCRLRQQVCEMSGIADTEAGYYIVRGGGGLPPYIDVIGFTRRVDWPDLIERLYQVRQSPGPIIE